MPVRKKCSLHLQGENVNYAHTWKSVMYIHVWESHDDLYEKNVLCTCKETVKHIPVGSDDYLNEREGVR